MRKYMCTNDFDCVIMKKNRIYPSITGYCSKICKAASYASLGGSFGSACSFTVTKFYKLDINFILGAINKQRRPIFPDFMTPFLPLCCLFTKGPSINYVVSGADFT